MIPTNNDMISPGELKPIQELTILSILKGEQPLNLTKEGAEELLVKAVSAQPEFQRDIRGVEIKADELEGQIRGKIRYFCTRCTATPTQQVCESVVRIETKEEHLNVRLSNYAGDKDMSLLEVGHARLEIECRPFQEVKTGEIRGKMATTILASDPSPWL